MISAPLIAAFGLGSYLLLDHKNYQGRLRRMAVEYVKRKYGFRAKAGRVGTMSIGWLEPKWHKGKSGYVEMSYEGKTFYVRASLRARTDQCSDTYQMREFADRIIGPLRDSLEYAGLCAHVQYGDRDFGGCYLGMDVTSFEDLVRSVGSIEVTVSAYGLDESRIAQLDLSYLGESPRVGIYDWEDVRVVEAGYTPVSPRNASDGDIIRLRDHYFYADGTWTHRRYQRYDGEGVTFAYDADLGIEVVPFDVEATSAEDGNARSPWYRLSIASEEETRVIVFPHETSPDVKMRIQFYDLRTHQFSDGFGDLPYYGNFEGQDALADEWPYHGAVWLNLTYKNGTVDGAPKVIRIVQ
ncbi:MAG: hypothetical protein IKG18_04500 [Atopobiaceae bacterium]|nr:hypothetical protein [Atopobiaceae bacterium]MBR3313382.1 hypothetical protein [Atopobiaceae bacterium]